MFELLNWLNGHTGSITAIATCSLAVATFVYVVLTARTLKEVRSQRLDAAMPIVAGRWEYSERELGLESNGRHTTTGKLIRSAVPSLHIYNCGAGTAIDVSATTKSDSPFPDGKSTKAFQIGALEPQGSFDTQIKLPKDAALSFCSTSCDIHGRRIDCSHEVDRDSSFRLTVNGRSVSFNRSQSGKKQ